MYILKTSRNFCKFARVFLVFQYNSYPCYLTLLTILYVYRYGQALLRSAKTAMNNYHRGGLAGDDPPPYQPAGAWNEAPPPAYQPPPGYYGWLPQHDAFSGPAPNTVFMSDNPPPYPGIGK